MANYSPGELANFNYITEGASYGTTPVTQLVWGCTVQSAKPKVNPHKEFHLGSTSRSFSDVTTGSWDVGLKLKGWGRATSGGYTWPNFWAYYGIGSATAMTEHLGSFSAEVRFEIAAAHVYWAFNGCKINKLTIKCDGAGQIIDFEADILAQWLERSASKTLAGMQLGVVRGADAAEITTAMLTWSEVSHITIAGSAEAHWYPKSWSIEVDNFLTPSMGNVYGADTNYYHCPIALNEGKRDIIFTCELDLEDEIYNAAKLAGTAITSIKMPIGSQLITLTNGEIMFEDDDLPEFKRDSAMTQPLRIKFKTIAVSTP